MARLMKLGLIAMSGVRAHNKELTELGLTLPGFVERNKIIASLPSLGLLTLAGMTPKDIDLEYLEVEDIEKVDDLPGDFDVVMRRLRDRRQQHHVEIVVKLDPVVSCCPLLRDAGFDICSRCNQRFLKLPAYGVQTRPRTSRCCRRVT